MSEKARKSFKCIKVFDKIIYQVSFKYTQELDALKGTGVDKTLSRFSGF